MQAAKEKEFDDMKLIAVEGVDFEDVEEGWVYVDKVLFDTY